MKKTTLRLVYDTAHNKNFNTLQKIKTIKSAFIRKSKRGVTMAERNRVRITVLILCTLYDSLIIDAG